MAGMQDKSGVDARVATGSVQPVAASSNISDGAFMLGKPVLVCRWRLAGRRLVMAHRHLRALSARMLPAGQVSRELVAWAKQHIEWTLDTGAAPHPDGVLMLVVDEAGQAAMTVGPYQKLQVTTLSELANRSRIAHAEAAETGVSPETLWLVQGDVLLFDDASGSPASGSASLVCDLAGTMGMPVVRQEGLWESAARDLTPFDEAFLVSDEHGVVVAADHGGPCATRFAQAYEKLCATERAR